MRRRMRRLGLITGLAFTGMALWAAPAFAWSGDTSLTATSSCVSQKAGTVQSVYTVHLQSLALTYGGRTVVVTSSNPAVIPVGASLTNGEQFTSTTTGTVTIQVNYPDRNGDRTLYSASATSYPVSGCTPVIHHPVIAATSSCGDHYGYWQARYSLVTADGGTPGRSLPALRKGLTASTDYLSVTFTYADGPDVTATATAVKATGCKPPPPPVFIRPSATFQGPCGDPLYRAHLNNTRSNRAVTFVVHYVAYSDGRAHTIRVTVAAGHRRTTRYFHVLGRTRMTITAAGHTLRAQRSAAPGNYGACPA